MLVVWSYDLNTLIPTCRDFEEKLIKLVWDHRGDLPSSAPWVETSSIASSDVNLTEKVKEQHAEAEAKEVRDALEAEATARNKPPKKPRFWGMSYFVANKGDVEKIADGPSPRPIRLFAPFYNGFGVALSICPSFRASRVRCVGSLHVP